MNLFDVLATLLRPTGALVSYFTDRPRLALSTRYIPEVRTYIIDVVNLGRKPTTITGAGITGIPWGYGNPNPGNIWLANETFPKRLQDRDCAYLSVWWGSDVPDREKASFAWIRDITGKVRTARLKKPGEIPEAAEETIDRLMLSDEEKARLYNLAAQEDHIIKTKARLADLETEMHLYETIARIRHERDMREAQRPPSVD